MTAQTPANKMLEIFKDKAWPYFLEECRNDPDLKRLSPRDKVAAMDIFRPAVSLWVYTGGKK